MSLLMVLDPPKARVRDACAVDLALIPRSDAQAVWVQNELLARTLVEIAIPGGCLVEGDDGRVDRFRDLDLVIEDRLHEGAVVLHHRGLPRGEGMGLRPAEADADLERPDLGVLVLSARVSGHVQSGDTE